MIWNLTLQDGSSFHWHGHCDLVGFVSPGAVTVYQVHPTFLIGACMEVTLYLRYVLTAPFTYSVCPQYRVLKLGFISPIRTIDGL